GFDVHKWDLRGRVLIKLGINAFVIAICYSLVMLFLKSAILPEWMRIFVLNHTNTAFFHISTLLIIVNTGLYYSALFLAIFAWLPVSKSWHFWKDGECVNGQIRDITNASFNLVLDIFIFILPQRMTWRLYMSGRRKFGISLILSVGLILYATITLDYVVDASKPTDRTYKFSQTLLWALAEETCMFILLCVPALTKLFAENNIAFRLASSLRSWTCMGSKSSPSGGTQNASWHRSIGSWSIRKRAYRRTNDDNNTVHSITKLAMMHGGPPKSAGKVGE
ncbi:hypothetical protein CC80DRAFT_578600, partial [Byssothecium circinans]